MPSAVSRSAMAYKAEPGQELREDPLDHGGGWLVNGQDVQALAISGLGRVGMRPGVDELVSVGRPAAEVAAFHLRLSRHRSADPDLDPVPLAFTEAAERRHDHVVGLVGRIDRPADFRHPQRHAVVLEQRERVAELVAVERALRLAHHDRLKAPVGVGQRGKQPTRFGPTLRRDGPGLVDIEELRDDHAAVWLDQPFAAGVLPGAGGLGILPVLGGHPFPGCERDHRVGHSHPFPFWPPGAACWPVWAAWALSRTRSRARAAAGLSAGGSSGSSTWTGLRLSP